MYSMKEVSKIVNLPTHTLRYYEEVGILSDIERNSIGQRLYSSYNLEQINLIKCLRTCGLFIKDIQHFSVSIKNHMPSKERVDILELHHKYLEEKQKEINNALKLLEKKSNIFPSKDKLMFSILIAMLPYSNKE